MLLRRSLSMLLFIGALALTGWAFVIDKPYVGRSDKIAVQYHGPLAGVLHLVPERQGTAGHDIAGNAVLPGSGRDLYQASLHDGGGSTPTRSYFERARMLLYLLRSRHWRKAAHDELRKPTMEHE
ncbi:hypothetical protein ACXHMN_02420 [Rhizobium sp. LEGMi12c]